MDNLLSFDRWENEKDFEVQLEPEGMHFTVSKDTQLKLIARQTDSTFYWHFRPSVDSKGITCTQVYPEGNHSEVDVFENGKLIYQQ
jgi:hypothetical protein